MALKLTVGVPYCVCHQRLRQNQTYSSRKSRKKKVCTLQSLSQKYIQCNVAMGGLHIIDPAVTLTAAIKCDLYFYIKGKVSVDFSSIIMYDESA